MNKFTKKLYYKFFDLFQISQFKQDKLVSDKAKMMMTLIKKNEENQLQLLNLDKAISLGFTESNYLFLKEFQETNDIRFISNYVSSVPEWIRNIVLPGFFSEINLGKIFSTQKIKTFEQLYSYFGSIDFRNEKGKDVSELYQHLVLQSQWNDFPLKYADSFQDKDHLKKHFQNARILGNFHNHTTSSDGKLSLEELITLAIEEDREYIGISDHSKSCHGGLTKEKLFEQLADIDRLNKQNSIKILKSIECEILPNGNLDIDGEGLQLLDYVIIAIHTHSNMTQKEMEKRIIRAIENPFSNILAHPSARIYKKKPAIFVDIKKIIDACIQNEVVIEINGDSSRLDLDPKYINYALEKGAYFSLDSDTHSRNGFKNVNNAIQMAMDYNIPKEKIINCLNYEEIKYFFNSISK